MAVLCVVLASIKLIPLIRGGYEMYQTAVEEKSIEDRIQEVRDRKNYCSFEEISPMYLENVVMSEDKRFYKHNGIDMIAIARAAYYDLKARAFVQGGSTITQQLAKNLCFSFEKRMERKIAEVFVAFDLERKLTKKQILELYCNIAYYGEGCNGIKEATLHYYGVEPEDLSLKQSSVLTKTLRRPNDYNPNAIACFAN